MNMRPNLDQLRTLIATSNIDALICASPENFTYVAGSFVPTIKTIRPRHTYTVLTKTGDACVIVCSIERSLVQAESWITDIRTYTEFKVDPIDALAEVLREKKLTQGTFGLDLDYFSAASFAKLSREFPNVNFINTTEMIAAIRSIKSAAEVDLLERTTRQTHKAIVDGLANSRLGDTDRTIANRIIKQMFDHGANGVQHLHLASGPRTPLVHNHPSDDETVEGTILRLDVGGTYGAFFSDVARTYSTGKPTPMHKEVYRVLCDVQAATIGAMRPGVEAQELYYSCKDAFERHGLPCSLPHIGHSVGVETHETPMIRPGDATRLKAGMVINIEPMTFDADGNYYHTEDLVVITESGYRLLTYGLAPKEIPVLGQPVALAQ